VGATCDVVVRVDVFPYNCTLAFPVSESAGVCNVRSTSRRIGGRQVGPQCIVNEARILRVSRDDFFESYAPHVVNVLAGSFGVTFWLTSPELVLIFKTWWDFKFHATCSVMALSTKHGLRNYCYAAWPKVCRRHCVVGALGVEKQMVDTCLDAEPGARGERLTAGGLSGTSLAWRVVI
jgi:hypothetical protein